MTNTIQEVGSVQGVCPYCDMDTLLVHVEVNKPSMEGYDLLCISCCRKVYDYVSSFERKQLMQRVCPECLEHNLVHEQDTHVGKYLHRHWVCNSCGHKKRQKFLTTIAER